MTFREYFRNSGVLLWLIAVNAGVFLLLALLSLFFQHPHPETWLVVPSSWGSFFRQPWTLLTYMFTQISFLHLLFNMLWLLWFGRIFLMFAPSRRLLSAYLGGGIAGAILFLIVCSIWGSRAGSYLVGSSAAVLSVMTAASVMAPNLELTLFLIGNVRLKYVALLCIALTFIGIGGGNAGGLSAHLGGVIFGLFVPGMKQFSLHVSPAWETMRKKFHRKRRKKIPAAFVQGDPPANRKNGLTDEERLDQLLDKVRLSGYDSLTMLEKKELNAISQRL